MNYFPQTLSELLHNNHQNYSEICRYTVKYQECIHFLGQSGNFTPECLGLSKVLKPLSGADPAFM